MRMLRMCAGALALALAFGSVGAALGEHRRETAWVRPWWGVLYGDALLLAGAEDGEAPSGDGAEVVFVWPLWDWLLRFLGFQ